MKSQTDATTGGVEKGFRIRPLPSIERVQELLDYDPATGAITRKKKPGTVSFSKRSKRLFGEKGYLTVAVDGSYYFAHRLAWLLYHGKDPGDLLVDHINGNRSDNRIANLRLATREQNSANIRASARFAQMKPRGVYWNHQKRKFKAQIGFNRKVVYLGLFACPWEAAAAYNAKALELFGNFAGEPSNVPDGFRHPITGEVMTAPIEETPLSRWPSIQGELFMEVSHA